MLLAAGADLCATDASNKMPIQHAEDVPGRREAVMGIIEKCVTKQGIRMFVVMHCTALHCTALHCTALHFVQ